VTEALLTVDGLVHRFDDVEALRGLTLSVSPGELYGLVGPDGAGKTTALRIVAGLMIPASGTVRVAGSDPADPGSGVRERLGYMPQQYSLYGDLSVEENLRFFGDLFCLDKAAYRSRSERLLSISRLGDFRGRRADALSGGMYKKLALSCALLHEPDLLVLDEPTNGVDPVSRVELWDLLHEFVAGGMAVVVSTPYMDEAERCRRVGLVRRPSSSPYPRSEPPPSGPARASRISSSPRWRTQRRPRDEPRRGGHRRQGAHQGFW